MLFSEPKIPQAGVRASSRSGRSVSVLFSEPKIPQVKSSHATRSPSTVSVLFSEPKIPQARLPSFRTTLLEKFQCSSASRKFLKRYARRCAARRNPAFQCSSASRKFLKYPRRSSTAGRLKVSVLFSEPKIPQAAIQGRGDIGCRRFSALQRAENSSSVANIEIPFWPFSFSALQRAENSSSSLVRGAHATSYRGFSALQRAENSSRLTPDRGGRSVCSFSALQRAENSSREVVMWMRRSLLRFQCSSASRKFLKSICPRHTVFDSFVSVLFSEPKIPQVWRLRLGD